MASGLQAIPTLSENNTNTERTDKSVLSMFSRLGVTPRPAQRRRLSDTSASADATPSLRPLTVRSTDGSRWRPTPDEQSHRRDLGERRESTAEPVEAPNSSQHNCSAAVCAVGKVFETTELLECILSFLDTKDVLSLRRTSKRWNSTLQSSPYLRLHFFTYPKWDRPPSKYQLLPLSLPGIMVERDEPIDRGQWVRVSMTLEAAKRICPEPKQRVRSRSIFEGLRGGLGRSSNDAWPAASTATPPTSSAGVQYEDLQIAQPPLLGMQAYILPHTSPSDPSGTTPSSSSANPLSASSSRLSFEPPAIAKLSCDAGITLGFLAATAQELLGSLKSGPSDEGVVKVVFKAIVSFYEEDAAPKRMARRNFRLVTRIG